MLGNMRRAGWLGGMVHAGRHEAWYMLGGMRRAGWHGACWVAWWVQAPCNGGCDSQVVVHECGCDEWTRHVAAWVC